MSNNRFWVLVLLHMTLTLHHVCVSGMWIYDAPSPSGGNQLPGRIVPNIEIYKPTCGWKLILKSSDVLSEISTGNAIPEKVDDHTFLIENFDYNKDLRNNPSSLSMTLKGDLGSTNPVITVNWYCICNETTANNCERVPEPDPHGISSSSDTSPSSSTTPTTFTGVTSGAVSSQEEYCPIPSNDTRLQLEKQDNLCYTGTYSELFNMRGLLNCGWFCLEDMRCLGINYWASSFVCNIVYGDTDFNSNLMRVKAGCEYYKVIGRGG